MQLFSPKLEGGMSLGGQTEGRCLVSPPVMVMVNGNVCIVDQENGRRYVKKHVVE